MSRYTALGIVLFVTLVTSLGVQMTVERCFWRPLPSQKKKRRAALAIRDHVIPFQKWGTRHFTWPYLKKYYNKVWYFTQTRTQDHRAMFLAKLEQALDQHEAVDLFFLAHGNHYYRWVARIPWKKRRRLRMVYNTGCKDLWQRRHWIFLGAKAYIGHPGVSASPLFYVYFLRRWTLGETIDQARKVSNQAMKRLLHIAKPVLPRPLTPEKVFLDSKAYCYGQCNLHINHTHAP